MHYPETFSALWPGTVSFRFNSIALFILSHCSKQLYWKCILRQDNRDTRKESIIKIRIKDKKNDEHNIDEGSYYNYNCKWAVHDVKFISRGVRI